MSEGGRRKVEPIERVYNAWVVVRPAEDLEDQWVAHVLDFDVVTQGNTVEQAIQMAGEATSLLLIGDLIDGEDPMLRRAPEECWEALWETVKHGSPMDPEAIKRMGRKDLRSVAVQIVMKVKSLVPSSTRPPRPAAAPTWKAPVAFASNDGAAAHC
jgi:predicted RNase H-like HicB family nuclease